MSSILKKSGGSEGVEMEVVWVRLVLYPLSEKLWLKLDIAFNLQDSYSPFP